MPHAIPSTSSSSPLHSPQDTPPRQQHDATAGAHHNGSNNGHRDRAGQQPDIGSWPEQTSRASSSSGGPLHQRRRLNEDDEDDYRRTSWRFILEVGLPNAEDGPEQHPAASSGISVISDISLGTPLEKLSESGDSCRDREDQQPEPRASGSRRLSSSSLSPARSVSPTRAASQPAQGRQGQQHHIEPERLTNGYGRGRDGRGRDGRGRGGRGHGGIRPSMHVWSLGSARVRGGPGGVGRGHGGG